MYGKEHWKEQHILSPNPGRKSLEITLNVGGRKSATKRGATKGNCERYPLLCLDRCALQSSILECLTTLSRSLMIHATKSPLAMQLGQRCWICAANTWNQFYNLQTSKSVKAFRSYKIWSCEAIFKKHTCIVLGCVRPLPPLVLLSPPSEHTPAELAGKGCTVEMMLNGFNGQPRSLWSGAVILRQVQCICSQRTCCSKLVVQNWFKTVQNYCLRSILFSSWGSLA